VYELQQGRSYSASPSHPPTMHLQPLPRYFMPLFSSLLLSYNPKEEFKNTSSIGKQVKLSL
jgi:hypothetical protein